MIALLSSVHVAQALPMGQGLAMDDGVAVEVNLVGGELRYFVTWGRIQDVVDPEPLAALVLEQARGFSMGRTVCAVLLRKPAHVRPPAHPVRSRLPTVARGPGRRHGDGQGDCLLWRAGSGIVTRIEQRTSSAHLSGRVGCLSGRICVGAGVLRTHLRWAGSRECAMPGLRREAWDGATSW